MKDFRLSIAQGHFHSCDLIPTIIHPCGILLLAQARPKMPCIYTSILFVSPYRTYTPFTWMPGTGTSGVSHSMSLLNM